MRWGTVDDTTWPHDNEGDVQWSLRYGTDALVLERRMSAASIIAAYAYLTDPALTQAAAIASLKRARVVASGYQKGHNQHERVFIVHR